MVVETNERIERLDAKGRHLQRFEYAFPVEIVTLNGMGAEERVEPPDERQVRDLGLFEPESEAVVDPDMRVTAARRCGRQQGEREDRLDAVFRPAFAVPARPMGRIEFTSAHSAPPLKPHPERECG